MVNYIRLDACTEAFQNETRLHSCDELKVYKKVNDQELYLGLYYPETYDPQNKHPLFVFVHGGGWDSRKIFDDQAHWAGDYLGFLARYYANRGYLSASVDYRLVRNHGQSNNYGLVELCEDCRDAVGYLKENAEILGIDLEDTVLLGESAGGYLAAAMVTLPWMERGFFKRAIIVNGITDLTDPQWGQFLFTGSSNPLLRGKSLVEMQVEMSPVCHVHNGICKTLLLHGAEDSVVCPFHSLKYHDLLQSLGGDVQFDIVERTEHAFLLTEYMQELNRSSIPAAVSVEIINKWLDSNRQ